MKIESLRLKGFIGIKRGLGLDEINIDFARTGGLLAFAGQNGLGKSTVLENLHPYNTLASRSGALFNHVCTRDAEKELSFSYFGHSYRTLLKIDCQSGKSEGFIWRDGESLVNGKIRDYAKKVVEIFGSENLFFNSVFCGQGSAKLSDMTTGELKTLFAEFLRLDRLQAFEENCKQKNNILTGKLSQIEINIEAIKKRIGEAQGTREELDRLNVYLEEQKAAKADLAEKLTNAQKERESLKETIARNEVLAAQVTDMKKNLELMNGNRFKENNDVNEKLNVLRKQYQEISAEIKDADSILANEFDILLAVEDVKKVTGQIDSLTAEIDGINIADAQAIVSELEKSIQAFKNDLKQTGSDARLSEIDREKSALVQQIKGLESQLSALEKRHPECTINGCSFIIAAVKAQEELPALKDRIEQLAIARENRMAELTAATDEINGHIADRESTLKQSRAVVTEQLNIQSEKRKMLATARMQLKKHETLAAKQSEIAVAKSKKEDRTKALEENKKQGLTISAEWTARKTVLDDQIQKQSEKINEITACIDGLASSKLQDMEVAIKNISASIAYAEGKISDAGKRIAALQSDLAGIQDAEAQLKTATEEKNRVSNDISEWTYIRNACGKNGLQALEIDGAAPLITGYANDLLSQAFGSLYSVKFRTQDDEGKECLDIVTIGEDGEEVLLDNLSGGQKTWILMALRLAMTLLSKEKGGRNFQTAFFDELDGPLDSENAVNFVNLYKSFMDIGHFETIPFISHKPECRSTADIEVFSHQLFVCLFLIRYQL